MSRLRHARLTGLLSAVALSLALIAPPVLAPPAAANAAALPPCAALDAKQLEADTRIVAAARRTFNDQGFPALKALQPDLLKVLTHAPKGLHMVEFCDGRVIIHAASMEDYLALGAGYQGRDTEWRPMPYPEAALLAGSVYVEYHDYNSAIPVLLRGVELAPNDAGLVGEAAGALNLAGRPKESLELLDSSLAGYPGMSKIGRARLLRARGFALTDLGRLDEAEADYRRSLDLDPGNPVAINELKYIDSLRKGGETTKGEPVNPNTGEPNKH